MGVLGNTIDVVADALAKDALDSAVDPAEVARQKFELERRGYDQAQVRRYLTSVADSLRDAQQREADMRTRLGKAVARAERAEGAARRAADADPTKANREVGDEVASVLEAARVAGEQKIAAAQKSADQVMGRAKSEATKTRQAAESILDERRVAAEAEADKIRGLATDEAAKLVDVAQADATTIRSDAAADIARVQQECDGLIREAEEARAQILQDMERRRRQARAQIERLRVGRDRLLRSYEIVRRTLDESTMELKGSLKEAKVLGDSAARKVANEPPRDAAQLEAELVDSRLIARAPVAPTPAPPAKNAPDAPATGAAPGAPNADVSITSTAAGIPHVDLTARSAGSSSAPTPKRPVVGAAPAAGTAVPKPPAVAPTIKLPEGSPATSPLPETSADTAEVTDPPAREQAPSADATAAPVALAGGASTIDEELQVSGVLQSNAPSAPDPAPADPAPVDLSSDSLDAPDDDIDSEAAGDEGALDFSDLPEGELAIIEASDDIEQVIALVEDAMPTATTAATPKSRTKPTGAAPSLFAALRAQANPPIEVPVEAAVDAPVEEATIIESKVADTDPVPVEPEASSEDVARQRDAIIAEVASDVEKRLKRALADEQNELLAGIRSAGRRQIELVSLVGETDDHVQRYVGAITDVAARAYAAGAALVDGEAGPGTMPAGAVEEIVGSAVVLPLRLRLIELDSLQVERVSSHVDALRAFYRQRKTDHLSEAATSLAGLLVTAGACEVLPSNAPIPWMAPA